MELADGSLLGTVNLYKPGAALVRLLRFSATGQLLQSVGAPGTTLSGTAVAPFSADSCFVLSSPRTNNLPNLLHFRIPGLWRVLAEPPLPPAQDVLAARPLAAAYPNPATESLTVPLLAGQPAGQLTLLDLAGRQVLAQHVAAGATQARLPVGAVAAGTYLLRYEVAGPPPATQRLTVVR